MKQVSIKFIKTHPDAQLPTRNHGNRQVTTEEVQSIERMKEEYYTNIAIQSGRSINDVKLNVAAAQRFYNEETREVYGTSDSGYDLYACEDTVVHARGSSVIETGLMLGHIEPGFWFKIEARSGLGFKHGIQPHFGIIDNGYRNSLGVKLYNMTDVPYTIKKGDRIAQIVIYPVIEANMEWVEVMSESERGGKGLGSSGK
jgi:dUTP pyrophosphatase